MNKTAQQKLSLKKEESQKQPVALVAGCAGFIGSFLCEELLKLNCHVVGVDNLVTGDKNNLEDVLNHRHFEFINDDINGEKFSWSEKIDYIFHLAGVEEYTNGKDVTLNNLLVNATGTNKLLEIAKTHEAKFELVSTRDINQGSLSTTSLSHNCGNLGKQAKIY